MNMRRRNPDSRLMHIVQNNNLVTLFLISLFTAGLILPVCGANTCGPSKGLVSGLTLSSAYIAPVGTTLERPAAVDADQLAVKVTRDAEDFVSIGRTQLESGNYQEAIQAFDQAIAADPKNIVAWNGKMSALLYLERYEDVLDIFPDAIKEIPDDFGIWVNKGRAENYLYEYDKAVQSADRALTINPESVDALVLKADSLAIKARPEAWEVTEMVLSLDPNNTDIWFARGHVLYSREALGNSLTEEEKQSMIEYLERDLIYHPERECSTKLLLLTWYYAGKEHVAKGRYEEGLVAYDRALAILPDYADAIQSRGDVLGLLGRYEEAIAAYDQVLKIDPEHSLATESRKKLMQVISEGAVSSQNTENVPSIPEQSYPDNTADSFSGKKTPDEYHVLMEKAFSSGDMEKVIRIADEAIQYYPVNEVFWSNKGSALNNLGRYTQAIIVAEMALKLNNKGAHGWFVKGFALEQQQKLPDAEIYYEKALALSPDNNDYREGLLRVQT